VSNLKVFNNWNTFFKEKGISDDIKKRYLLYLRELLNNDVPIIFEFTHLSLLLGRQKLYLASVINSPCSHYTTFKIKKRSGGEREITMPFPALIEMQYWIFNNVLTKMSINSSAHGFAYKKSIITNSKIHVGQKELLKVDLKDFFTSISINRIIDVFKQLGYTHKIAFYLASICSYDGYLPQGAPTSPILSNIISRQMDERLIRFAKKFNLRYTRYADDLTFSGENLPAKFISYIADIITSEGFEININKTRLYKNSGKRIVTGISVCENEIKIPRSYKRELKQELHYIFTYGYHSHISKKRIRKSNYLFSLIGKVNFWLSVEPNNDYALKSRFGLKQILNSIPEHVPDNL
jgi:RNA-directed DNA polymerase